MEKWFQDYDYYGRDLGMDLKRVIISVVVYSLSSPYNCENAQIWYQKKAQYLNIELPKNLQ